MLIRLFCSSVHTYAPGFLHACCLLKEKQHGTHSAFRRRLAHGALALALPAQPCQQGSSACLESTRPVKIRGAVLFTAGCRSGAMKASRHSAMRSMPAALGCRPSGSRPCRALSIVRQGDPAESRVVGSEMLTGQHQQERCSHPKPWSSESVQVIMQSARFVTAETQVQKQVKARPCQGPMLLLAIPQCCWSLCCMRNGAVGTCSGQVETILHCRSNDKWGFLELHHIENLPPADRANEWQAAVDIVQQWAECRQLLHIRIQSIKQTTSHALLCSRVRIILQS